MFNVVPYDRRHVLSIILSTSTDCVPRLDDFDNCQHFLYVFTPLDVCHHARTLAQACTNRLTFPVA